MHSYGGMSYVDAGDLLFRSRPEQKPQEGEQLEPGYFPLKPSGPIY
jgi:hypothetical protein